MTTPKRFYYVAAPNSKITHLHYGKLGEGEKVKCGRRMAIGWKWHVGATSRKVCVSCARAG